MKIKVNGVISGFSAYVPNKFQISVEKENFENINKYAKFSQNIYKDLGDRVDLSVVYALTFKEKISELIGQQCTIEINKIFYKFTNDENKVISGYKYTLNAFL